MAAKILLADDSNVAQRMGREILSAEGFDVDVVSNGQAALKKLKENLPDLILADIFMPGANGYEICQFIKSQVALRHIPVALLVGTMEPYDQGEGQRVKADGHITKPFQSSNLVRLVKQLLASAPPPAFAPPPAPAATPAPVLAPPPVAPDAAAAKQADAVPQEVPAEPPPAAEAVVPQEPVFQVPQEMAEQPLAAFEELLEPVGLPEPPAAAAEEIPERVAPLEPLVAFEELLEPVGLPEPPAAAAEEIPERVAPLEPLAAFEELLEPVGEPEPPAAAAEEIPERVAPLEHLAALGELLEPLTEPEQPTAAAEEIPEREAPAHFPFFSVEPESVTPGLEPEQVAPSFGKDVYDIDQTLLQPPQPESEVAATGMTGIFPTFTQAGEDGPAEPDFLSALEIAAGADEGEASVPEPSSAASAAEIEPTENIVWTAEPAEVTVEDRKLFEEVAPDWDELTRIAETEEPTIPASEPEKAVEEPTAAPGVVTLEPDANLGQETPLEPSLPAPQPPATAEPQPPTVEPAYLEQLVREQVEQMIPQIVAGIVRVVGTILSREQEKPPVK